MGFFISPTVYTPLLRHACLLISEKTWLLGHNAYKGLSTNRGEEISSNLLALTSERHRNQSFFIHIKFFVDILFVNTYSYV